MNIIVELLNNVANLKVEGRLDTITAPELDKKINEFKETNTWAHMLQPRIQLKGNGS